MIDRPLLAMPEPERREASSGFPPRENLPTVAPERQGTRMGPKFRRLERSLATPETLVDLRDDPAAIVPERALVFEVASEIVDFYRAVRGVTGLEFLGEDEGEAAPDEDFFFPDDEGWPKEGKLVPRRFYFTLPDRVALLQLISLWKRYQKGEELGHGRAQWKHVFAHLVDVRPWGPRDRLTEDTMLDWHERLEFYPEKPVRFEVEFWYRNEVSQRKEAEKTFIAKLEELGGKLIDRAIIEPIRYHALLVEMSPSVIRGLLENSEIGLVAIDEVMIFRPQSMVLGPVGASIADATQAEVVRVQRELNPPVAALLDGVPMASHDHLAGRLVIEDPDEFGEKYGAATEQQHGTAMASLILHGDLNEPNPPPPVNSQLYVRPVMYPQSDGSGNSYEEALPSDRLSVDLIWRAFIRMFEGEGDENPSAPTVRVVNLSLGNKNHRFTGLMSPWARLIDYLAWEHGVLILISAGNVSDSVPLEDVSEWIDVENADEKERQEIILRAVLKQRAKRRIFSPSESINALTIGAAHSDHVRPNGCALLAINPYVSPFLPNLSSALGLGLRRAVKPEILLPGGAEQVRRNSNQAPIEVSPVKQPANFFGIGVASPSSAGETDRKLNMSGTSVATALATHGAIRILEALDGLPDDPEYPKVDPTYYPVLMKALLVHSAGWDCETEDLLRRVIREEGKMHWEHERHEISRFLGFGCPDVDRVINCSESRATLIGWGTIEGRQTDRFRVPLPYDLEGVSGFRALCVTIAWLTPITHEHRMYRLAKLKAESGGDKAFSIGVGNSKSQPSHNTLGKGTVYHHRWEGEDAADFVDGGNLVLDVTCSPTTGRLDYGIPYAVATTLEVGVEMAVSVYENIREQLKEAILIR